MVISSHHRVFGPRIARTHEHHDLGGVGDRQYPLPIYRTWFRKFFTYIVPLACVNYLPALAILERGDPLGFPIALQWCAPLICVIFLIIALQIWKIGVRYYRSTGS